MSIFDRLRANAATPVVSPAPAPAPAATTTPAASTAPLPITDPASIAATAANLWDVSTDPVNPAAPVPFSLGITAEGLQQVAEGIDVVSSIPESLRAAIAAGGQGALDAMVALQNHTAQQAFKQNVVVTNALIEQAVGKMQDSSKGLIDQRVKQLNLQATSLAANPALNDPLIAPIVQQLQQRAMQKHPNASTAEINTLVSGLLAQVGGLLNPTAPPVPAKSGGSEEYDWLAYGTE